MRHTLFVVAKSAAALKGGGIVPVDVFYEIHQYKISHTGFIPAQQNLLNIH